MSGFLQKGTRIPNLPDILVVSVPVTVGPTSFTTAADNRLIGARVLGVTLAVGTDIAKLSVLPTISATGVVTVTYNAASTAIATAYVQVALATGNI